MREPSLRVSIIDADSFLQGRAACLSSAAADSDPLAGVHGYRVEMAPLTGTSDFLKAESHLAVKANVGADGAQDKGAQDMTQLAAVPGMCLPLYDDPAHAMAWHSTVDQQSLRGENDEAHERLQQRFGLPCKPIQPSR
jgi:hypothetical protein